MNALPLWDVYLVTPGKQPITGVKFRGTTRKRAIEQGITMLVENASDKEGCVRFAVPTGTDPTSVQRLMTKVVPGLIFTKDLEEIPNPILAKKKTNIIDRYD